MQPCSLSGGWEASRGQARSRSHQGGWQGQADHLPEGPLFPELLLASCSGPASARACALVVGTAAWGLAGCRGL